MTFNAALFLKTVPNTSGVYRMYDADHKVIYVGKAKDLKKRLQSYFRDNLDSAKTRLVMSKVHDIQFTVTHTENEALILENNLIKELRPRYNILMRDDKSYPFIILTKHQFPRLSSYRGIKRNDQNYFGPYPSGIAVRESLDLLHKLFCLRSCTDSYFKNRTRPCLQYQIKRCSAPCVNFITPEDYARDVKKTLLFLTGKSKELVHDLATQMQAAAAALDYEQAALLRDQIEKLNAIQQQQNVMQEQGNFDVVVVHQQLEQIGIGLLHVSEGKLLGSKNFMPQTHQEPSSEILAAFLTQYYLAADTVPTEIIVNVEPSDHVWLASALSEYAGHKVTITIPQRGEKMRWLALANDNLLPAINAHIEKFLSQKKRWQILLSTLQISSPVNRIECFDISHSQGEATVASCVVFDENGAVKKEYRRFNITDITPGDDYAALRQAIQRRYSRLLHDHKLLPELVIIDGGKNQLQQAINVFAELKITDTQLISIAKGPGRNPNFDVIWRPHASTPLTLPADSIALHLIQQIRDEAHRFALTGHKAKRGKQRQHSILEDIEGIGAKRRRDLLQIFGGLQGLQRASLEEISAVPGISNTLALKIYKHIH